MHLQLWRTVIAFTLFFGFHITTANGFLKERSLKGFGSNWLGLRSLHSSVYAREGEDDEEPDGPEEGKWTLADHTINPNCAKPCGSHRFKGKGLGRRSACGGSGGSWPQCDLDANSTASIYRPQNRKRALEDLKTKTREELEQWIARRVQYDGDVEMIFDSDRDGSIRLIDDHRSIQEYPVPTALFKEPGNTPFAWGSIGLTGCTMMVIVKEPSGENKGGVYMGHYWEVPGWDVDEDHPRDKDGNIEQDDEGNNLPMRPILKPQFTSWVTNFLKLGFPHDKITHRADNVNPPNRQTSLAEVKDNLDFGRAIIIHPRKTDQDENGEGPVQVFDGPQYKDNLEQMQKTVKSIFNGRQRKVNHIEFLPNFLYVPDRQGEEFETSHKGRTIFEYDPNYNGRKTGMLLIEDGGEKGNDGIGPGGPFYFDFGAAEAST